MFSKQLHEKTSNSQAETVKKEVFNVAQNSLDSLKSKVCNDLWTHYVKQQLNSLSLLLDHYHDQQDVVERQVTKEKINDYLRDIQSLPSELDKMREQLSLFFNPDDEKNKLNSQEIEFTKAVSTGKMKENSISIVKNCVDSLKLTSEKQVWVNYVKQQLDTLMFLINHYPKDQEIPFKCIMMKNRIERIQRDIQVLPEYLDKLRKQKLVSSKLTGQKDRLIRANDNLTKSIHRNDSDYQQMKEQCELQFNHLLNRINETKEINDCESLMHEIENYLQAMSVMTTNAMERSENFTALENDQKLAESIHEEFVRDFSEYENQKNELLKADKILAEKLHREESSYLDNLNQSLEKDKEFAEKLQLEDGKKPNEGPSVESNHDKLNTSQLSGSKSGFYSSGTSSVYHAHKAQNIVSISKVFYDRFKK